MNDFENIQRLLRLKRYENPGDDFVEDFVTQFRERQRSELLRQSARGLLWERVNTFFSDLVSPKWATAGATAAFAVVAAWGTLGMMDGGVRHSNDFAINSPESVPAALQNKPSFAMDSELIREAYPQEPIHKDMGLLSRHFEGDELAARFNQVTPISAELLPVSDFER